MSYQWDFLSVLRGNNAALLWHGALGTVELTCASILVAVPLGLLIAMGRLSSAGPLQALLQFATELLRSSALLVLIFWFFFAFPLLLKIEINAFQAAVLAIGLQSSAYFAELFRGSILSVPRGQWEAACALGLHLGQTMRLVVLPLAIRQVLPVMLSLAAEILKSTSLAAAIAFTELSYVASQVGSQTYRPLEIYTIVALIYFVLIGGMGRLVALLERSMALKGAGS